MTVCDEAIAIRSPLTLEDDVLIKERVGCMWVTVRFFTGLIVKLSLNARLVGWWWIEKVLRVRRGGLSDQTCTSRAISRS